MRASLLLLIALVTIAAAVRPRKASKRIFPGNVNRMQNSRPSFPGPWNSNGRTLGMPPYPSWQQQTPTWGASSGEWNAQGMPYTMPQQQEWQWHSVHQSGDEDSVWHFPQRRWPWGNSEGSWPWENEQRSGMWPWGVHRDWQSWDDWQKWQTWQKWQSSKDWQKWQMWQKTKWGKPSEWDGSWWWNGEDWSWSTCSQERYGRTPECPAKSCKDIFQVSPWSSDGKYWVHIWGEDVVFPVWCDMSEGGWTLVSRMPSGMDANLEGVGYFNPANIWESMRDFDDWIVNWPWPWSNSSIAKPYQNRFVRHWKDTNIDIKKVRIVLIDNQEPVKSMWFDAIGSSKTSWFSNSKLERVWPNWTDLPKGNMNNSESGRVFAINGDTRPRRQAFNRSWIINKRWDQLCTNDQGWFMAVNARASWEDLSDRTSKTCPWERRWQGRGMHWLYSKLSTKTRWANTQDVGQAEGVLIYVW